MSAQIMLFTRDMFSPLFETIDALPSVWKQFHSWNILYDGHAQKLSKSISKKWIMFFSLIVLNISKNLSTDECNFSNIYKNTTRHSKLTLFTGYILMWTPLQDFDIVKY